MYKTAVDPSSGLDDGLKRILKEARDAIEQAEVSEVDKADAVEDLGKLTAHLEKLEQDSGLVKRYYDCVKELIPLAANLVSSAKNVADMLCITACHLS